MLLELANAALALNKVILAITGKEVFQPVLSLAHTPQPQILSPENHSTQYSGLTVAEAINDFLVAKCRSGKSDRYLRALKNSLSKFARGRTRVPLDKVSAEEIELWLHESDWAPRTQEGYLLDVRTLYNFCVRRGLVSHNPANAVDLATSCEGSIGVHTPEQVRRVLELARATDKDVMRWMAVRYFAGLRSSEAEQLAEEDIKLEQGLIEVKAHKSKTRRRRLVTISDNLRAWLGVGGQLPLANSGQKQPKLVKALALAGVPWPRNAPRHSFCSYHLAQHENAGKTALEAGHSEFMLFHHYRAIVTREQAREFWSILPG